MLDDYSPLREITAGTLAAEGALFPVRDAWWFVPSQPGQAAGRPEKGSDDFTTPNPPKGALLTYYLKETPTTAKESREATEKTLREKGADTPFPGFDRLREEALESGPKVLLVISDTAGRKVRWIEGPAKTGLHRVNWDLRAPSPDPVDLNPPGFRPPWAASPTGPLTAPGRYSAELVVVSANGVRRVGTPQLFEVKPVPTAPSGTDFAVVAAFQQQTAELRRQVAAAEAKIRDAREQLRHMRAALVQAPRANPDLFARMDSVTKGLAGLSLRLSGDPAREALNESAAPSISGRVGQVMGGHWETRQMPTATQRRDIEVASSALEGLTRDLRALIEGDIARLKADFEAIGAPWTPGR